MDYTRVTTALAPPSKSMFGAGDPADLVALADLKLELDKSDVADDRYLARLITRASQTAAHFCGRSFVPAIWRDRVWPARDPYPWQVPSRLTRLQLSQWPLTASPSPAGTAPPQAPTLSAVSGGALAAAKYFARLTYVTAAGETAPSLENALPVAVSNLLQIAAPGADALALASGYNVYVGTAAYAGTKQNAAPIALGQSWTLPTGGLVEGDAAPDHVTVVEETATTPCPLAEGVDFVADAATGQIDRLFGSPGLLRPWSLPATVVYSAGYAIIPADLAEAVILLAKMRWFSRLRDPMVRAENVEGIQSNTYWGGTGIGGQGDMPADVTEKLERYRALVVA